MEYHLERGLRLHTKPEYRSLYGWAINEVDAQDQQIGHDQIPWPWSLYFTATSCVLRDGIEIRLQYKNHEATPEPEIAQRQLIRVQLRPNDMRTTSVGRLTRCSAQTAPSIASSWKSNRSPTQTGELDQNEEDYRVWKALDEVLRELEPRSVPKPVDLAHTEIAAPPEHADAKLPQVDDAALSFVRRDRS